MLKKPVARFKEWRRKRRWPPELQLWHLLMMVQADNRWLSHDPIASELTERYLRALADNWESQPQEDVSAFRTRIGLDPHRRPASTDSWKGSRSMSKATDDVLAERQRQIEAEGWTDDHDDAHGAGELASAGMGYAQSAACQLSHGGEPLDGTPLFWPWEEEWWKPKTPRRDLVRAAALLIAEIERLDRVTAVPPAPTFHPV